MIGFGHFYHTWFLSLGVIFLSVAFHFTMNQDYYFKAYLDELTNLPSRRSLNEEMMNLNNIYTIASDKTLHTNISTFFSIENLACAKP